MSSLAGTPHAKSAFSIRTMLLSAIAALSLLAMGAFGWNAMSAWQRYELVRNAQEFDAGANKFITGLFELLMERLYTNNGLQAAEKVRCPVTFVLGERDQMTTPKHTREIAKALRAHIVTLPAGHTLMTEVPDGVLNALREALARPVEHS